MNEQYDRTLKTLGEAIGQEVVLDKAHRIYDFERPMIMQAYEDRQVIAKTFRKTSWRYGLLVFVSTWDPHHWRELVVKDEDDDGTFRPEPLRYSEGRRLVRFLASDMFQELPSLGANEEKYYLIEKGLGF